jgi:hypothetical protein
MDSLDYQSPNTKPSDAHKARTHVVGLTLEGTVRTLPSIMLTTHPSAAMAWTK